MEEKPLQISVSATCQISFWLTVDYVCQAEIFSARMIFHNEWPNKNLSIEKFEKVLSYLYGISFYWTYSST